MITYWNFLRKHLSNKILDAKLSEGESKKSVNKSFLVAILIAVLIIGGGILLIWKFQPSMQEQQEQVLADALREGSPEFDVLTRRIIAETNEDETIQSPVGTGFVMMQIAGRIRNNGDKTLTGLEIKVSVIDSFGKVIKDQTALVVPNQRKKLAPKEQMNVSIRIDGFDPKDDRARIQWKVTAIKTE